MAHSTDCLREMFRTPVIQIVTVDRGNHNVVQAQLLHCIRNTTRFKYIESVRFARRHVTERAATGANLAHDHHGGVTLAPAFASVRACGLFTDGRELVVAHNSGSFLIPVRSRCLNTDPRRLLRLSVVWAVRLFRVPLIRNFKIAHGTSS